VIDNVYFVFAMALVTYVNRIAPPSEHTQTLSMGVAMNHVAAVLMPLVGGYLWVDWGSHWVFILGAVAAALSVLVAHFVPPRETEGASPDAAGTKGDAPCM
jgi:MFS family permease